MKPAAKANQSGFSLIEVLVAAAMLGILVSIMSSFTQQTTNAEFMDRRQLIATALAQQMMEQLTVRYPTDPYLNNPTNFLGLNADGTVCDNAPTSCPDPACFYCASWQVVRDFPLVNVMQINLQLNYAISPITSRAIHLTTNKAE